MSDCQQSHITGLAEVTGVNRPKRLQAEGSNSPAERPTRERL